MEKILLQCVKFPLHTRELRHKVNESVVSKDNQTYGLFTSGGNGQEKSGKKDNKLSSWKGPKPDDVRNYYKEKGH